MRHFYLLLVLVASMLDSLFFASESTMLPIQDRITPTERETAGLPKDVYPDSLARLPRIRREDLDEDGKRVYDFVLDPNSRYPGQLSGPVGMWLYSPRLAEHMFPIRTYLRFETQFDRRLTEMAVLVTAKELDNHYMWTSHERFAREAGVEPEIIDIIKRRKSTQGLRDKEALIILFGRELMGGRKVSSQTFARALQMFGQKGVIDLSAIVGFYSFVATTLNTFDLQLRED